MAWIRPVMDTILEKQLKKWMTRRMSVETTKQYIIKNVENNRREPLRAIEVKRK